MRKMISTGGSEIGKFYKLDFEVDENEKYDEDEIPTFYTFPRVINYEVEIDTLHWVKVQVKTDALIWLNDFEILEDYYRISAARVQTMSACIANYMSGIIYGVDCRDVWEAAASKWLREGIIEGAKYLTPSGKIIWMSEFDQKYLKPIE